MIIHFSLYSKDALNTEQISGNKNILIFQNVIRAINVPLNYFKVYTLDDGNKTVSDDRRIKCKIY